MSDLNNYACTGRLGADPEARRFQDGRPIVNLRVAISDTWKDRNSGEKRESTLWLPVSITAEGLCKVAEAYLKKGSRVALSGALKSRSWEKDGQRREVTELHITPFQGSLTMLDGQSSDKKQDRREPDDIDYGRGQQRASGDDYDDGIPF